jgi:hypothetical protein
VASLLLQTLLLKSGMPIQASAVGVGQEGIGNVRAENRLFLLRPHFRHLLLSGDVVDDPHQGLHGIEWNRSLLPVARLVC